MKVTTDDILEVIESAEVVVDTKSLQNDIKLTDQGVDSLDIVNIYLLLEEKFDIKIPDEDLSQVTTVNDIVEYVNSKL